MVVHSNQDGFNHSSFLLWKCHQFPHNFMKEDVLSLWDQELIKFIEIHNFEWERRRLCSLSNFLGGIEPYALLSFLSDELHLKKV